MAALQNFRSALNGFNREDVVHYIEYLNNTHAAQLAQLNTEINELRSQPRQDNTALLQELEESKARCAALEQEAASLRQQLSQPQQTAAPQTGAELEAYRRAERAERLAAERVNQLYSRANAVLADATVHVDETAAQLSEMADRFSAQLLQMQDAVASSKNVLLDAAAAMYAVRPIATEE